MSDLVYVDANVYISYFRKEQDSLRPISDFAFEFVKRTLSCKYNIVISSFVLKEVQVRLDIDEINSLLTELRSTNKLETVRISEKDIIDAKQVSHWQDRLHEILAAKAGARYLVTRNVKDFAGDLVQIKLPENL